MKRRRDNWFVRWCRSYRSGFPPFIQEFTAKEIKKATDGFSMILGSGCYGTTYRARFPNGHVASVRKASVHDKVTFNKEVLLLGRLHHRHLVRLQGFCEGRDRYLVFDHIENGSLKEYLHDPLRTPINWRTRLQIAVDIAAALEYLLCFCDPPVYSVFLNSNNVLLDENFVAKIANVGLVDSLIDDFTESNTISSRARNGPRSRELMFQFGVVILELITGQSLNGQDGELIQWVQESEFAYTMHKMVDTDLGDDYNSGQLKCLLFVARLCIKYRDQPTVSITQMLRFLQGKLEPLKS